MNLTCSRLTRIAGVSAAAAGAIFVGVQIKHPPADVAHLVTTEMAIRESAKILMCPKLVSDQPITAEITST